MMSEDDEPPFPPARVWLWEGHLQFERKNHRKAREAFEEALRIGLPPHEEVECRLALAETFFFLSHGGEHVERHHKDVASHFEAALRLDQQGRLGIVTPAHLLSGAAVLTDLRWVREADQWPRDWRRRIDFLSAKRRLVEHVPGVHMLRTTFCIGMAHHQLREVEPAIREYRNVMECEISPHNDETPVALKFQAESRLVHLEEERSSNANTTKSQSSGCWIATAVMGSQSAEVTILKAYRDTLLARSLLGRLLIAIYSLTSPAIAHAANRSSALRHFLRRMIVEPASWWAERRLKQDR